LKQRLYLQPVLSAFVSIRQEIEQAFMEQNNTLENNPTTQDDTLGRRRSSMAFSLLGHSPFDSTPLLVFRICSCDNFFLLYPKSKIFFSRRMN
jgi:hypothetical protein